MNTRRPLLDRLTTAYVAGEKLSRTVIRTLIGQFIFPERGDSAQREAGMASALAVISAPSPPSDAELLRYATHYQVDDEDIRSALANLEGASAAGGGSNRLNPPDPTIPQDEGVAAFFDVDNTLIKGASILLLARGLARRRFFSPGEIAGFVWKQAKFRVSGRENTSDMASGREQALAIVKGRKESEVVEIAQEIWEKKIAERIFPGTKMLAEQHLKAGQQVWLVTATPVQLAQIIAKQLGFTGALGTVAEVKDGRFTGRMVGDILHGSGKKYAVVALAAHEQLDLERCTAYSDSVNDLPMLSTVGQAIAVNPDSRLRQEARFRGWEIQDYRRSRRAIRKVKGYWVRMR